MAKVEIKGKVVRRGGRVCGWCGQPINEHPYVGARSTKETRFCDVVPVFDRERSDGTGRVVTAQAPDDMVQRTKKNNLRLIHTPRLVR